MVEFVMSLWIKNQQMINESGFFNLKEIMLCYETNEI